MNEKTITWVIGILGVALVSSILLLLFYSGPDQYEYEGPGGTYQFVYAKSKSADVYFNYMTVFLQDQEYIVPLRHSPYEVESIPLDLRVRDEILVHGFDSRWMKTQVLFTQDPNLTELTNQGSVLAVNQVDLILNTDGLYGFKTFRGFTKSPSNDPNYETITCKDATVTHSVIEFRYGEPSIFVEEENCVIVQGNSKDSIMAATDKLIMHFVGVF